MKWIAGILASAVVAAPVWGWDFSKHAVPIQAYPLERLRTRGKRQDAIGD